MDKLNLDSILPEEGAITVGGKDYTVYPPTLKQIAGIQRYFAKIENAPLEEQAELFDQALEMLDPVIPGIKDVDLTTNQFMELVQYVTNFVTPDKSDNLQEEQVQPEKKGVQSSPQ